MEALLNQTLSAINVLYHGTHQKEQASMFLSNLQNSTQAWDLASKLLTLNPSGEACYYGAQTLKYKIQNNFLELPSQIMIPFQNSLYEYIFAYAEHNVIVTNQLCVALADFILRSEQIEETLAILFNKLNHPTYLYILYQVLIDVSEELQGRALKLGTVKRGVISQNLSTYSKDIIKKMDETITNLSSEPNNKLLVRIYKCLERWIESHLVDLDATLMQSKVFNSAMDNLKPEALQSTDLKVHEKAADVFVATIIAIEEPSMYPELSQYLVMNIVALAKSYQLCVSTSEVLSQDESVEKAINYASLFTELGNLCLTSIISTPNQGFGILAIVELLLDVVSHEHNDVSEITMNFWYNFAECLYNNTSVTKDESKLTLFKPYVNTLLQKLFVKITLEDDYDEIPDSDDDIGEGRCRIYELIQDLAFASDPVSIINQMIAFVKQTLPNGANLSTWPSTEAAFFLISALIRELTAKAKINPGLCDPVFLQLCDIVKLQLLPQILTNTKLPPALINSSVDMVSEMGEWLAHHSQQLDTCLGYLIDVVHLNTPHPSKSQIAIPDESLKVCMKLKHNALKAITVLSENASKNSDSQALLINIYLPKYLALAEHQESSNNLIDIPNAAVTRKSPYLSHSCRQELIKAICITLPYLKDQAIITHCLSVICEKLIQGLLHEINTKSSDRDCDPTPWLDQISALFKPFTVYKSTTIPNILMPMIAKIWPILNQLFLSFQTADNKTEKICRTIKHIFRAVGKEGSTFILPQLVETIVNLYQTNHHSSYLYLGSVIIEEFYSDQNFRTGLLQMYENFTLNTVVFICDQIPGSPTPTLQGEAKQPQAYIEYWNSIEIANLSSTVTAGLKQIPDVVEDYFRLSQKCVKYMPLAVMKIQSFEPIVFKIFLATCYLDHREAHSAAMLFFCDMISSCSQDFDTDPSSSGGGSEKQKVLAAFLNRNGQQVIDALLRATAFFISTQLYPEVADVLYELMVYDKPKVSTWMDKALTGIQEQQRQHYANLNLSPSSPSSLPTTKATASSLTPNNVAPTDQSLYQFKLTILNATQEKHITRAFREFATIFK